jgi:hypothetical protein
VFKTIGKHVTPPAGARSPALWGTKAHLNTLFPAQVAQVSATPREFVFRYRSPAHWLEVFRTWYGPVLKKFGALDAAGQEALAADLIALIGRFNRATDGTMAGRASISRWLSPGARTRNGEPHFLATSPESGLKQHSE